MTVSAATERVAIVLTPALALLIVAGALRLGAGGRVRGARLHGRGPGHGRSGLALQLQVIAEEGGVPEALGGVAISMSGTAHGTTATWDGSTNADGIAEAWLALPGVTWGDAVHVRATAADGGTLVEGAIPWPGPSPAAEVLTQPAMPARRSGELWIDVFLPDGKLVPGFSERAIVSVKSALDGSGIDGASLTFLPEPGLSVEPTSSRTANGGTCEVRLTAEFLLANLAIEGSARTGPMLARATWVGALPVAPGAAGVELARVIPRGTRWPLDLVVPLATRRLYVEVDDPWGRDFGAALDIVPAEEGGSASLMLPALSPGTYWLVTSSDARGAERLDGSTMARSFTVASGPGDATPGMPPRAAPFVRTLELDGLALPRRRARERRNQGLAIALAALGAAAVLEVVLLLRAAHAARGRLSRLVAAVDAVGKDAEGAALSPDGSRGVVVLILATLLGLALIAALLMVRGQ